ncbi:MAG: adenine phosphoribosyltransferase [Dehalococcoidia bacterium]|nr:adenine phosphoribosyltransferase [Dehalococcoidia bacterium]
MPAMELKSLIRDVPDFPAPGVLFRDITPLLGNAAAFSFVLDQMVMEAKRHEPGVIVGIESRGFLFGAPLADRLGLPFVPVRKPGKLPAARMTVEYSLEYGQNRLDIHEDAMAPGARAYIVDDLLATGGTALATAKLVEMVGGTVAGFIFAIELVPLGGRPRLDAYPVHSLLVYD